MPTLHSLASMGKAWETAAGKGIRRHARSFSRGYLTPFLTCPGPPDASGRLGPPCFNQAGLPWFAFYGTKYSD